MKKWGRAVLVAGSTRKVRSKNRYDTVLADAGLDRLMRYAAPNTALRVRGSKVCASSLGT